MPKPDLPLKAIVLDDTMSDWNYDTNAQGGLDTNQLSWLVRELNLGQTNDQLMVIAAHIPIEPLGITNTTNSAISNHELMAELHKYPNLILWVAGHMHRNNIKAEPSPDTDHPECGFWQVENPSLRDFPQQFRTYEILRNTDNTVSIRVTDIDPDVTADSQAGISRGYAIGASRIFRSPSATLADTNAYVQNAELVKLLTPRMQAKIAGLGGPLGTRVTLDPAGSGVDIGFLGRLQAKGSLLDPFWNAVPGATGSPYTVSSPGGARFFRSVE
jgi:hypothetical protein